MSGADAALLVSLGPGACTFHVRSATNATGTALVEAYDLDPTSGDSPRTPNVSARAQIDAGQNALVGGLVVQGPALRTLLIRAIGPGLTAFGVPGVLSDPKIDLVRDDIVVASNDNWDSSRDTAGNLVAVADLRAVCRAAGAFPLVDDSKDAALLVTIPPGNYSVVVSGVAGATGVALFEAYEVPP